MTNPLCEQLDLYLLDELADDERETFERHFTGCEACRTTAQRQTHLDGLLKAAAESVACPPGLARRVRTEVARVQKPSRKRAAVLAIVAASIVVGLAGRLLIEPSRRPNPQPEVQVATNGAVRPAERPVAAPSPRARVEFPRSVMAVPVESGDPDVTLIQVYFVVETSENLRRNPSPTQP